MSDVTLSDDQAIELLRLLAWYCQAYPQAGGEIDPSDLRVKEVAGDLIDSLSRSRVAMNVSPSMIEALRPDSLTMGMLERPKAE